MIATKNSPANIDAGCTRRSPRAEAGRSRTTDSNGVSLLVRVVVDVTDVASLLEVGCARVSPDHEDRLVSGVLEPVIVVLRNEDDLSRAELDVGVANASDSVARNEVLELFGVRVTMNVVLRPWGEDRDPEDGVLCANCVAGQKPADVHVNPAVLSSKGAVAGRRIEAGLHRMLTHASNLGHRYSPHSHKDVHVYWTLRLRAR